MLTRLRQWSILSAMHPDKPPKFTTTSPEIPGDLDHPMEILAIGGGLNMGNDDTSRKCSDHPLSDWKRTFPPYVSQDLAGTSGEVFVLTKSCVRNAADLYLRVVARHGVQLARSSSWVH